VGQKFNPPDFHKQKAQAVWFSLLFSDFKQGTCQWQIDTLTWTKPAPSSWMILWSMMALIKLAGVIVARPFNFRSLAADSYCVVLAAALCCTRWWSHVSEVTELPLCQLRPVWARIKTTQAYRQKEISGFSALLQHVLSYTETSRFLLILCSNSKHFKLIRCF